MNSDRRELTEALRSEALRLGFRRAQVCPAAPSPEHSRFLDWLEQGYAGEMRYLQDRAAAYQDPQHVLAGARSILMLAMDYAGEAPQAPGSGQGQVSRYAWGDDYHDLIHSRLKQLAAWLRGQRPGARARGVVDTAPLLERDYARQAGLGWIGKNTLLLDKSGGSWFFLAALLTDLELAPDDPSPADHCGTCTACLDACPTDAFPQPYVLDARRCISYLTIELRGPVPLDLRSGLGSWLLGCDICQEVCPWNRHAQPSTDSGLSPRPGSNPFDLIELLELDEPAFRRRFRHTPLWRPRRSGLLRNAALILGNQRHREAAGALRRGLTDVEPLIRGACAWALGQIGGQDSEVALRRRLEDELDEQVREELAAALEAIGSQLN